mmetsp:Transcript_26103/g.41901  ORF Transcript_26103/g.41901 Transcript_26103/m.41901 type:complete len:81 (+) Transcript_26103:104-346(+)
MRRRRTALDLGPLLADIDALEAECAAVNSPTVLLHNDLLSGNFLVCGGRSIGDDDDNDAKGLGVRVSGLGVQDPGCRILG